MQEEKRKTHYEIQVKYFVCTEDEGGIPVEVEKTETVRVAHLNRTDRMHSKIAMMLRGRCDNIDTSIEIAELFLDHVVDADPEVKLDIKNDIVSCAAILGDEKVQDDVSEFIAKINLNWWGNNDVTGKVNYVETLSPFFAKDPLMMQKAIVSRYFSIPIDETDKLSVEELDKWVTVAHWISSEIDLKPFNALLRKGI